MIVVAGGVMPDEDVAELKKMGVTRGHAAGHAAAGHHRHAPRLVAERGAR